MHNKVNEIKQIIAPIATEISTPSRPKTPSSRMITCCWVKSAADEQSNAGKTDIVTERTALTPAPEQRISNAEDQTHMTA